MRNEYFFDIHPPLGKLTFWAAGKLVGYNANDCSYVNITDEYGKDCKYVELRACAALFSTLSVWLVYFVARGWGSSVYGGLIAAGLVGMDMLNLIEGRLILMDSQLFFWLVASLLIAQRWWTRHNLAFDGEDACAARGVEATPANDRRVMSVQERAWWAVAVGLVCGCAFSVKMTGLATPAIIGLESFFGLWFLRRTVRFPDLLLTLFSGLTIYTFFFAIHFWLCFKTGDGDAYMTYLFQTTLKGSRLFNPKAVWEGFWWNLFYLNHRMVVHNASILEPHPWQTSWWEWVLNLRGLLYYSKDTVFTVGGGSGGGRAAGGVCEQQGQGLLGSVCLCLPHPLYLTPPPPPPISTPTACTSWVTPLCCGPSLASSPPLWACAPPTCATSARLASRA